MCGTARTEHRGPRTTWCCGSFVKDDAIRTLFDVLIGTLRMSSLMSIKDYTKTGGAQGLCTVADLGVNSIIKAIARGSLKGVRCFKDYGGSRVATLLI